MAKLNRDVVCAIMDKMKIERTEKIPLDRAQVKLTRTIKKDPGQLISYKFTDEEKSTLAELGFSAIPTKPKKIVCAQVNSDNAPKTPDITVEKVVSPGTVVPVSAELIARVQKLKAKGKSEKLINKVLTKRLAEVGLSGEAAARRMEIIKSLAGQESREVTKKSGKDKKGSAKKPTKADKAETTKPKKAKGKEKVEEKPAEAKKPKKKAPKHDEEE